MHLSLPVLHRKDPLTMALATALGIILLTYLWVLQFGTFITGTSLIGHENQELDLFASLMFTIMAPMIVMFLLLWARRTSISTSFIIGVPLPMIAASWICLGNIAAKDVTGDAQLFLLLPLTYATWLLKQRPAYFVLCYIVAFNGLAIWLVEGSLSTSLWDSFVTLLLYLAFASVVVSMRDRAEKLEREFHSQSQTDSLTGLYNRFILNKRIQSAVKYHNTFALAIVDIDYFKTINDNWGHLNGDQVLQAVTRIIEESQGLYDTAARLGGDELAIVMVDVTDDEALARCTNICNRVRQAIILSLEDDVQMKVTVSIGVSLYPLHVNNDVEIYRASDYALYSAKCQGRDQAVLFNPVTMALHQTSFTDLPNRTTDDEPDAEVKPIEPISTAKTRLRVSINGTIQVGAVVEYDHTPMVSGIERRRGPRRLQQSEPPTQTLMEKFSFLAPAAPKKKPLF